MILSIDYTTTVIKLIVFLGNPGQEYKNTRHNVAFSLFDEIVENDSLSNKFHSIFAQKDGFKLIKPMTFMNLSGTAVSEAASFYKLKSDEILVCHDDSELPLGKVKFQMGGGLERAQRSEKHRRETRVRELPPFKNRNRKAEVRRYENIRTLPVHKR